MSKPLVEKYEQLLAQDPTSTVFVELARAYLDKNDTEKAIAVCRQGCEHHPGSVVGRVLWGKALIQSGKASDAMQQFDAAIAIDRENPYAYNLIAEVLVRKALYRSALPMLRKAVSLQPGDARVQQWLDQAKAALAGGPSPSLEGLPTVADRLDEKGRPLDESNTETPATKVMPAPTALFAAPSTMVAPVPAAAGLLVPLGAGPSGLSPIPPTARQRPAPAPSGVRPPPAPSAPAPAPSLELAPRTAIAPRPSPARTSSDPDVFAAFAGRPAEPEGDATVLMGAYQPRSATVELPVDQVLQPPPPVFDILASQSVAGEDGPPTQEVPAQRPASDELPVVAGSLDPFSQLVGGAPEPDDLMQGLTSTFDALQGGIGALPSPSPRPRERSAPPVLTPNPIPVIAARAVAEVPSEQNEIATSEVALPAGHVVPTLAPAAPRPAPKSTPGLLDDLPDLPMPDVVSAAPREKVEFSTQATEAIAHEYEQELRKKLEANTRKKTFLQKHGLKLLAAGVAAVVALGLGGSFWLTWSRNSGQSLGGSVSKGQQAVGADTKEQYLLAIASLSNALTMDSSSIEAAAWLGYAEAMLFAEHGREEAHKAASKAALSRAGVRDTFPDLALVADWLTTDAAEAVSFRQRLLARPVDGAGSDPRTLSRVHTEVGRLLLADKKAAEAFKHLKLAVDHKDPVPKSVRPLVALGEYYLKERDFELAEQLFSGAAEQLSKFHPARVVGLAEARLELGRGISEAAAELEGLAGNVTVPPDLSARYALALGRTQAGAGKHEAALATLEKGLAAHPSAQFEFTMALGHAHRSAGRMDKAQKAFEDAVKQEPNNEDAKEGLGRVLLARSREKELLDRLRADSEWRTVALLRGIAAFRLGELKRARAELSRTKVKDKYPAEAVVYLALIDAQEAGGDKTVADLEGLLVRTKRHKATVQVALGRLYMQRGALDKAKVVLEEAAKDPLDYEGNSLLGELLLSAPEVPVDIALEPLFRTVERNGSHAPARHLLVRTLLALGRWQEAQKQCDGWTTDNPAAELAWKDTALVAWQMGRGADAEAAVKKGIKDSTDDIEALRIKAQVLFARGDGKGAFAALERANKLNSKDAETFCEIALAFVRQGNPDTALKAFEAAIAQQPKSFCGRVGPHLAKPLARGPGKVTPREELEGLVKGAASAWDRALALSAQARVVLEERDFKRANELADEAIQSAPSLAHAHFALAEVARKTKNDAKFAESLAKAAELDQSWTSVRLLNGDRLLKANQSAEALAEYESVVAFSQNEADSNRAKKMVTTLQKQLMKK
jgi:cellulose synthase operon protein C